MTTAATTKTFRIQAEIFGTTWKISRKLTISVPHEALTAEDRAILARCIGGQFGVTREFMLKMAALAQ